MANTGKLSIHSYVKPVPAGRGLVHFWDGSGQHMPPGTMVFNLQPYP
jgi:hypothetical protein